MAFLDLDSHTRDLIVAYDSVITAFAKVGMVVKNEKELGEFLALMKQSGCNPSEFEDIHQFIVGAYNAGQG